MTDKAEELRYIRAGLHAAREAMIDMAGTAAALLASQAAEIERITDVWHALHKENIRLAGINAALKAEIAAHKLHIEKLYSKLENRAREFSPGDKS